MLNSGIMPIVATMILAWAATYYLVYWLESGNRVRFSLRTLLIVTTLVAIALGAVLYGVRK